MGNAAFLQLLLSDEVSRRESRSATLRTRTAGQDPTMRWDTWTESDDLRYDRQLLSDLTSLRSPRPVTAPQSLDDRDIKPRAF